MGKQKTDIKKLVQDWEKQSLFELRPLVLRTAATLSAVPHKPQRVMRALDILGRGHGDHLATYVCEVVEFLRELERLQDLTSAPPKGSGANAAADRR